MNETVSRFDTGAATHVGKLRERNEDNYLTRPEVGIWSVADGMGGHAAGDLASATLVQELQTIGHPHSASELLVLCEDRVLKANAHLRKIARERGTLMGSTLAALLIYDQHFACLWSGDSRIYLVRNGEIQQISRDHTEVQELISEGLLDEREAKGWPGRNIVTRAIGVDDDPRLEMRSGVLEPDDVFVVCSDGLTLHLEDSEILDCVNAGSSQAACERMIALTLERGAEDNVTVIVVRNRPDDTVVLPEGSGPAASWGA
ncbi:MAG TPA: protein phosphatase 2C domain-containing protein [Xanthobacteraceae bacterium]|nr:protein phosphatase 2C domain-containing protein [Xanthobacteraceae bacterium]